MTTAQAAGSGYDFFTQNGADWPLLDPELFGGVNECGNSNQSPINLSRYEDYPVYDSKDDKVTKFYSNQYDAEVQELADTTKVNLGDYGTSTYHSMLA